MKKTTESDLVHSALVWLNLVWPDGVWWRANCGSTNMAGAGQRKRFVRFGVPGMSDIQGVNVGRAYFIECKTAKGKQTPLQIAFQAVVEHAGAVYLLVRSIEDLEKAL